ncbi:hypothetical protein DL98DRAFT_264212 [Cadophora sp. DSE1049]|nr:hypothetical protein DL98DRAFT_264212 [Cadophora sp. DSE1049]
MRGKNGQLPNSPQHLQLTIFKCPRQNTEHSTSQSIQSNAHPSIPGEQSTQQIQISQSARKERPNSQTPPQQATYRRLQCRRSRSGHSITLILIIISILSLILIIILIIFKLFLFLIASRGRGRSSDLIPPLLIIPAHLIPQISRLADLFYLR